ncbi:uncharacterized protein [Miscanthus floridulus]|uniref:uncharacterized protein isoform X3 n=1 Tax=Miscanthus floridulus TaxID=154761 RepID=UPI003457C2E0
MQCLISGKKILMKEMAEGATTIYHICVTLVEEVILLGRLWIAEVVVPGMDVDELHLLLRHWRESAEMRGQPSLLPSVWKQWPEKPLLYCSGSQASKHMRNGSTASTISSATRAPFFCSLVLRRNHLAKNKHDVIELPSGSYAIFVLFSSI